MKFYMLFQVHQHFITMFLKINKDNMHYGIKCGQHIQKEVFYVVAPKGRILLKNMVSLKDMLTLLYRILLY